MFQTVVSTVSFGIMALSSGFWTIAAWPYCYPYVFSRVMDLSIFHICNLPRCHLAVVLDVMFCRDEVFLCVLNFQRTCFISYYFVNIDWLLMFLNVLLLLQNRFFILLHLPWSDLDVGTKLYQSVKVTPLPSNRQYLSCDACLEVKREDNQNCSVLCCVRQLCTMIRI